MTDRASIEVLAATLYYQEKEYINSRIKGSFIIPYHRIAAPLRFCWRQEAKYLLEEPLDEMVGVTIERISNE
jgi:hypothetical protein